MPSPRTPRPDLVAQLQDPSVPDKVRADLLQTWRPLRSDERSEVLAVLGIRVEELHRLKEQQWRYTYLTLGLDAALSVSSRSPPFADVHGYSMLAIAAAVVGAIVCWMSLRNIGRQVVWARLAMQTCYTLLSDPANASRVGLGPQPKGPIMKRLPTLMTLLVCGGMLFAVAAILLPHTPGPDFSQALN